MPVPRTSISMRSRSSDLAVEIIGDVADGFLFPNDKGDGPLPAHAVAKSITKAQGRFGLPHWTAHDLRRTALTKLGELGIAPIVRAHVVNHRSATKSGVTLGVYDYYDYAKEKREALNVWAARLDAIVWGDDKVLPMRGITAWIKIGQ